MMRPVHEQPFWPRWILATLLTTAACSSQSGPSADTSGAAGTTATSGGASGGIAGGGSTAQGGSSASSRASTSAGGTSAGGLSTAGSGGKPNSGGAGGGEATSLSSTGGATLREGGSGGGTSAAGASGGVSTSLSGAGGTGTGMGGSGGTTSTVSTGGTGGASSASRAGAGAPGGASSSSGGAASCPVVDFGTWPAGKAPADIGKLAVNNFKSHTGDSYGYAWTFAYFGSLQFTQLTGDTSNNDLLVSKFDCGQTGPNNGSNATVDDRAFGDLPFEIYLQKQTAACKTLGLSRADAQWANTTADGITKDARYWIDDMYMITGLQVFAYRATKDTKYLERAAKTMQAYFAALQQSDGLFWHTRSAKAYWGRANGWVASGMTELLLELPAGATRDAIMAGYKKQMEGLLPLQITSGADAGCWRQVLDRTDASAESSCTAMFTFALVTGLKNGWLSGEKYLTAARNGWTALGEKTGSTGVLAKICPGTGAAPNGDLASQQQFYMKISLGSNDQHGQAPLLWSATALLRQDCRGLR